MRTRIKRGTKNVFADLGFPDAETHLLKAELMTRIQGVITAQELPQVAAANFLHPSPLIIAMRRSTLMRRKSALRTREKSPASIPVRLCAFLTVRPFLSSVLMISAARIAFNWRTSASGTSKSR